MQCCVSDEVLKSMCAHFLCRLYRLESLVELDLSNNNLQWLSNDIRQLRCELYHTPRHPHTHVHCCILWKLPPSIALHVHTYPTHPRHLRKLHLQGNELAGLPSTTAELRSLKTVNVANNFMHPLLWREMTRNQPQVSVVSSVSSDAQHGP